VPSLSYAHLSDRAVIRVGGPEAQHFLQNLVTADIDGLEQTGASAGALLTPQGKILFDFLIHEDGDALLVDGCAQAAPALSKRLALYKLRADVTIEPAADLGVFAHDAPFAVDGAEAAPDPRHPGLGWRLVAPAKGDAGADGGAYEARRLAVGAPEFGKDFDGGEMFPMDVNYDALAGVSYRKGCFVGQEVASRMKRKGEVRKRTLLAALDGPAPQRGAPVTAGASTLGEILSAETMENHANGKGTADASKSRALALIRLDRWDKARAAGEMSVVNGAEAVLSFPDYLEQD